MPWLSFNFPTHYSILLRLGSAALCLTTRLYLLTKYYARHNLRKTFIESSMPSTSRDFAAKYPHTRRYKSHAEFPLGTCARA